MQECRLSESRQDLRFFSTKRDPTRPSCSSLAISDKHLSRQDGVPSASMTTRASCKVPSLCSTTETLSRASSLAPSMPAQCARLSLTHRRGTARHARKHLDSQSVSHQGGVSPSRRYGRQQGNISIRSQHRVPDLKSNKRSNEMQLPTRRQPQGQCSGHRASSLRNVSEPEHTENGQHCRAVHTCVQASDTPL